MRRIYPLFLVGALGAATLGFVAPASAEEEPDFTCSSPGQATSSVGTPGDDIIYGTAGNDVIDAGDGSDFVCGLGGNDTINGGEGDDFLLGGLGNDTINGGNGDDGLAGGDFGGEFGNPGSKPPDGNDILDGGNGNDFATGQLNNDLVMGGNGADELFGGPGADTVEGGNGDDSLTGNFGADTLDGGNGDDLLNGGIFDTEVENGPPLADSSPDSCDGGRGFDQWFDCQTRSNLEMEFTAPPA